MWTPRLSVTLPVASSESIDFRIDAASGRTEDAVDGTDKTLAISSSTPVETTLSLVCVTNDDDDAAVSSLFADRVEGGVASLIDSLGFAYDLSECAYVTADDASLAFLRKGAGAIGPLTIAGSQAHAGKNSKELKSLTIKGPFSLVQANADRTAFSDLLVGLTKVRVKTEGEIAEEGGPAKVHLADIVWTVSLANGSA